jgi:hypothetical protein
MGSVPAYSHVVVVVMENHNYSEIAGNTAQAPYIDSLMAGGANLTNMSAIVHPSQPNYFALYAGSTFGTTDDNPHSETGPTIDTILQANGLILVFKAMSIKPAAAAISTTTLGFLSPRAIRSRPISPVCPRCLPAAIIPAFHLYPLSSPASQMTCMMAQSHRATRGFRQI